MSNQMPVGSALVGDFNEAVAIFAHGPLTVETSNEHVDFFVRGSVLQMLVARTLVWVRNPTALCLATGL